MKIETDYIERIIGWIVGVLGTLFGALTLFGKYISKALDKASKEAKKETEIEMRLKNIENFMEDCEEYKDYKKKKK